MRIISKICIFSICVMLSSTTIYGQVNEFEGEVKFSNIKKSNNSESILVTDEDGVLSYKEISSFNIPNFIVNDHRIELIVNGESHVLELTDKTKTSQTITNFKLNGRTLEIEVSNLKEPLQVDLSPLLAQVTRSSATGAFSTTSNVTSNMPGDPTSDDLVFGSESLDDTGIVGNDSRVTFDKSKGSFRAGTVDGTQWDEANRGLQSAAFGSNTKAEGASSFAAGNESSASGVDAVAMGFTNTSSGNRSFSAGNSNMASGNGSISIGTQNMSTGTSSLAAGFSNTASNNMSIALGNGTTASGIGSTSIGTSTMASGNTSFAGGNGAMAIGANSMAFGINSKARQQSSFALGKDTDTNGKFGLAAGVGVLSQSRAQISLGSYNTSVVGNVNNFIPTDRLFVIGNGEDVTQLSDALVMLKNGNTTLNGTLKVDEGGAGNGYTFPGSDGMMNQVMQTDGSGMVTWVDAPKELPSGGTSGQVLTTDGSGAYSWTSKTTDTDDQNLGLGTKTGTMQPITISDGTGVTIDVADNDNSPTNEIELPSGGSSGQVLSTNGSGTYSWVSAGVDTDDQNLGLGTKTGTMQPITISDGAGVTIDVADNDNSPTNEIELPSGGSNGQVLSTNGSGTYSWVAQTTNTDTDDQNLSLGTITGTMVPVNISDGTGVTINVADNDNNATNEIQNLSSSVSGTNRTINISGGGNGTTINVADNDNSSTNEIELPSGGSSGDILSTNGSGTYTWIAPPSGGGGCSAFGDGSAGNVTISSNTDWSTNPPSNGNYMFDNLTINSGRTLTVPSGTVIYCSGTFTNNGTIIVKFGVPRARWAGNIDGGFPGTSGLTFGQRIAYEKESFRSMHRFGAKGGANGIPGGFTGADLYGGAGGGTIVVLASGGIVNGGTITANGEDGALSPVTQDRPGTGGGGGGFILLASGGNITNSGTINANGGDGSDAGSTSDSLGGAGGGGGLIHLLSPNANAVGGTLNINGGTIGSNNGTVDPNSFDSSGLGGAGAGDGGLGGFAFGSIVLAQPGAVGALLRSQIATPCNILD